MKEMMPLSYRIHFTEAFHTKPRVERQLSSSNDGRQSIILYQFHNIFSPFLDHDILGTLQGMLVSQDVLLGLLMALYAIFLRQLHHFLSP